ncbi:hypothetical protein [Lichenibacterium dinghuense]|uniref:hypothetical protein n=1 Tax=Lichenibacterium dinghuense TaxID=2895977 RepID=UPI001F1E0D50|nr:hypothetical protein [Lichenibacterium sp. 6Y81]
MVLPVDGRPDRDRRRVATHEAGHAVAATLLGDGRLVSTSITPTHASNGGTALVHRDEALLTRDEIEVGIVMLLAGRAAEMVVLKESTAAAGGVGDLATTSDLAQATSRLTAVHASYGLGQGLRYRGDALRSASVREDREIGQLVEADLRRLMVRAERFLAGKVDAIRAVADALLERGFLDAAEVERIVAAAGAGGGSPN